MKNKLLLIIAFLIFSFQAIAQNWTFNAGEYANSMTVTGIIKINGNISTDAADKVGAFVGTECRGIAQNPVAINGDNYYFLMVYSNTAKGETVSFKIFDNSANTELAVDATIEFSTDKTTGSAEMPYIWAEPAESADTQIYSFEISGQTTDAVIDETNHTILLQMPYNADVSALTPVFTLPDGATAYINGTAVESGVSTIDFTNTVTFSIIAADGTSVQEWQIAVTEAPEPPFIPNLILTTNILSLEGGNSVDLSPYLDNTDDQQLLLTSNILSIDNGNSVDLSPYLPGISLVNNVLNIDGNSTTADLSLYLDNTDNQQLIIDEVNKTLQITGGNIVDITNFKGEKGDRGDPFTVDITGTMAERTTYDNEAKGFSFLDLDAGNLYIKKSATVADWSNAIPFGKGEKGDPGDPASDDQTLILSGQTLTITGGNTVTLTDKVNDADFDPNNEIQTLQLSSNLLSVSGANSIDLSPYKDNTDEQTLTLSGNLLSIANGNSVDLSPFNTTQALTFTGDALSISGGNQIDLSQYADNTDAQTLSFSNHLLSIQNGNQIDLSEYADNTDAQTLSLSGSMLTIENGNTIDLATVDNSNEIQQLVFDNSTNILSISSSNSVDLSSLQSQMNTDNQTLLLTTNILSIKGGNNVDLSTYLDNSDNQTLSISDNQLTISGGNTISLPTTNGGGSTTEFQDLTAATLVGTILTIEIENGASVAVDLSSLTLEIVDNVASNEARIAVLESKVSELETSINIYQSTIDNQQSIIDNHQSIIDNQQSTIDNQQSTIEYLTNELAALKVKVDELSSTGNKSLNTNGALLLQNVPNPVTNETRIDCILPAGFTNAEVFIIDSKGAFVKSIPFYNVGYNSTTLKKASLAAGAYQYSLYVDGSLVDSKTMVVE